MSILLIDGTISQTCQGEVSAAFSEVLGTVILLGSFAIGAVHHKAIKTIEAATPENEEVTRQMRLNALVVGLKGIMQNFIYKQPSTAPVSPEVPPETPQNPI